jgi:hypothetical protein
MLAGAQVVDAMVEAWLAGRPAPVARRLVAALQARQAIASPGQAGRRSVGRVPGAGYGGPSDARRPA